MKKTARYYAANPAAKAVKADYNKSYQQKPSAVKKRVEANAANRKAQAAGTAKRGDGKDASHTSKGIVMKPQSTNRGSKKDQAGDRRARG